uniref:Uncharacterized protein n=1 Tax=Timema shepardi TaxID=629360 RepID=A0A7R9B1W6_TIMSH|nr:unnamed protein product [Timema shepardi]
MRIHGLRQAHDELMDAKKNPEGNVKFHPERERRGDAQLSSFVTGRRGEGRLVGMVREGDEGWRRLRDGDWNLDSREEGVCKGKNDTYRDVRTSTMRYSLLLLLVTSVVTFNVLKLLFMSWFPDLMMNLSLGLLTIVLADLLVKLAANVLPRKLLPDLENKAVFITGAGAQELKSDTSSRLHIVPLDVTKEKDVDKAVEYVKSSQGNQGLWAVINNAGVLALGETELMPVEIFQRIIEVNTIGSVRVTKAFLPLVRKSKGRLVFTASSAERAVHMLSEVHLSGRREGELPTQPAARLEDRLSRMVIVQRSVSRVYLKCGRITSTASTRAGFSRITFPGLVPYSMSKHAIVSFIDGLRREMRKWSVTVHGIEPMIYRLVQ